MSKPIPMIYNKSVWEVTHKVSQSLRMGQIFTVTEAQPTITDVVFDDGTERRIQNRTIINRCRLLSMENCAPVLYLRRGDEYFNIATYMSREKGFGEKSNYSIRYSSEKAIKKGLFYYLRRSRDRDARFYCDRHDPARDTWTTEEIDPVWCRNMFLFKEAVFRMSEWYSSRIPQDRILDYVASLNGVSYNEEDTRFIREISTQQIGDVYIIDNPIDIPLLKLHYGDDIRIYHRDDPCDEDRFEE